MVNCFFSVSEDETISVKPEPVKNIPETKPDLLQLIKSEEAIIRPGGKTLEEKIAAFEHALSPLRPPSPERVSMEGPFVHLHDHNYNRAFTDELPLKVPEPPVEPRKVEAVKIILKPKTEKGLPRVPPKPRVPLPKPRKPVISFRTRTEEEERNILTDFLSNGIDAEDILMMRKCFENMSVDPASVIQN